MIKGEPGTGKSHLIVATLEHQGYQRLENLDIPLDSQKCFFLMPAGMNFQQKLETLKKAFDAGVVLLLDEINTIPLPIPQLNAYLMGQTPEGSLAKRPGFMLFATQNAIALPGRQPLDKSIARRLSTLSLSPYTTDEMKTILLHKGLSESVAAHFIQAYERDRALAIQQRYSPIPTFRDLKRAATTFVQAVGTVAPPANLMLEQPTRLPLHRQEEVKVEQFCRQFIHIFQDHTNSTGIKRIIQSMQKCPPSDVKTVLGLMQNIAKPLQNRWLSKQRFFCIYGIGRIGSGRDTTVVQPLYDKLCQLPLQSMNDHALHQQLIEISNLIQSYQPWENHKKNNARDSRH